MARSPLGRTVFWVFVTLIVFFLQLSCMYHYLQKQQETDLLAAVPKLQDEIPKVDLYSCDIDDPLALNALSRVKTESCRLKLTEAACKLKNNLFHDTFPESACNNHDSDLVGSHIGCYSDSAKNRTLTGFQYVFKAENSIERCQAFCYRAGFVFFGLEYGQECFCGNRVNAEILPRSKCAEYTCPGNATSSCGGFNAINVFHTGLIKESNNPRAKYVTTSEVSSSTTQVKILFLLQLNGRNDRQVKRLLKAIYSPHHFYYIHVDQRQLYMLTEMKSIAALLPNVYVAPDGHSTIWGGASLLQMVQDAIRRSLSMPDFSNWDYIINLSESDFPVLSLKELEAQLINNRGKTFLASHGYNTARFIQKQGFDYVFMECEERMWRIAKREDFPKHLRLDGGSDWLVLHRDFARYSISDDELPAKMRTLFASIILPVESFFHTLAYNSPYCDSIISSHLRLTNWNRKQGCRCASLKKVVDWCGCSPLVFKRAHTAKFSLEKVVDKAQYIARKFESLIDIDAIAVAESQALRHRSNLIQANHMSFNSTFVNFYKADIDGYSLPNFMLAEALCKKILSDVKILSLLRIDIFKANSTANHQMIFSVQTSNGRAEVLVQRLLRGTVSASGSVDGFELKLAQFGMNIDHKEEIFRGITAYVDSNGSPTVALRWSRIPSSETSVDATKTSPSVKYTWINSNGVAVAVQSLVPYDSIYGTQFSTLELSSLNETLRTSGTWSVTIGNGKSLVANVTFPVFNVQDPEQFSKILMGLLSCFGLGGRRANFRSILQEVDQLSSLIIKGNVSAVEKAAALISTVSEPMIGVLPHPADSETFTSPVIGGSLRPDTELNAVDVFGFRERGVKLPLHDHNQIHGFLKCLRGSFMVRSFSPILDSENFTPVNFRYEGCIRIDSTSECQVIYPHKNNLHEIEALEAGSFFFDILVPPYEDNNCNYFTVNKKYDISSLIPGDIVQLDPAFPELDINIFSCPTI